MEKENFNVKVSNKIIEILDRDMETFNQKNRNSMINKIIFTYLLYRFIRQKTVYTDKKNQSY